MNKKVIQNIFSKNRGSELPLVVIVGPTASGKSSLGMRIAKEFKGEIICADSRTVYKDLDIGTTKPSKQDREEVPHWGLDLVAPGEVFTAADFKKYAAKKVKEIRKRGHMPMLVGGSGLYADGIIFDYKFGKSRPQLRKKLENMTLQELINYCTNNNISLPENHQNRRYVIRAIEQKSINSKRLSQPIPNCIIVGIATERSVLKQRIEDRAEQLFENGMVEEAKKVGNKYGWESQAMTGNIYKLVKQFLDKKFDEDELKLRNATADWQLAKRQLTWLKRNPFIHWATLDDAYLFIKKQLSKPAENE